MDLPLKEDLRGGWEGVLEWDLEGGLERDLEGDMEGDSKGNSKGDFRGDFKQDLSGSGQVQVRSGSVYTLQLKFNPLELDSEVWDDLLSFDFESCFNKNVKGVPKLRQQM